MTEKSDIKVTILFIAWKIYNVGGNSMLGKIDVCSQVYCVHYEPLRDSFPKYMPRET